MRRTFFAKILSIKLWLYPLFIVIDSSNIKLTLDRGMVTSSLFIILVIIFPTFL